ncbi:hypothetical protein TNCV_2341911 [Trichonephila clavipes]|uniref:Uncharacterized protein n=1 Tax=Trichonephila clavipes TaxID=2585209 RepID=A0A8X6R5C4_TRICX|nr:hypothetical protein TNCV_2341911 [Trichonephila clavipes]
MNYSIAIVEQNKPNVQLPEPGHPGASLQGLTGRHFPEHIPPTGKKSTPTRQWLTYYRKSYGKAMETGKNSLVLESFPCAYFSISSISEGRIICVPKTVSSLVVRALDSRLEGLGLMPDPSEYTRSTCSLNQWSESPVGDHYRFNVLENISLFSSSCLNCKREIDGVTIYRVEVKPVSGSANFPSFSTERTQ